MHSLENDVEIANGFCNSLLQLVVALAFDEGEQQSHSVHFELVQLDLVLIYEAFLLQNFLGIVCKNQFCAVVDYFSVHQRSLVLLARALDELSKRSHQLVAQVA